MFTNKLSEQILQALGAPVAGLFLMLSLFSAAPAPPAHGVRLLLLREGRSECGDSRPVVVHFEQGGSVWVNEQNVGTQRVPAVVAEIMATRAERAVFLLPGKDASTQDVASLASRLDAAVEDLHIGMVTYRQYESMERDEHGIKFVPIACMAWPSE